MAEAIPKLRWEIFLGADKRWALQGWHEDGTRGPVVDVHEQIEQATPLAESALIPIDDQKKILDFIRQAEGEISIGYGRGPAYRLERIWQHYRDTAALSLRAAKDFRDDCVIQFRAMGLVVEMAGNAATHGEKNARLRGMAELIDSAVRHLGEVEFDVSRHYWAWESVFRNDFPTRRLMDRIHELEREVEALRPRPTSDGGEPDEVTPADLPF